VLNLTKLHSLSVCSLYTDPIQRGVQWTFPGLCRLEVGMGPTPLERLLDACPSTITMLCVIRSPNILDIEALFARFPNLEEINLRSGSFTSWAEGSDRFPTLRKVSMAPKTVQIRVLQALTNKDRFPSLEYLDVFGYQLRHEAVWPQLERAFDVNGVRVFGA
jgi:hypothetical protein